MEYYYQIIIDYLFSVHMYYNFREFYYKPINWRTLLLEMITNNDDTEEGPKIEEIYMKVAEKGYDAGKYDIQYHEPTSLIEEKNKDDYNYDYIKVSNKKDDKKVKRLRVQSKILYKDPVEYKYGITPYVPSYSDAILLSNSRKSSYQSQNVITLLIYYMFTSSRLFFSSVYLNVHVDILFDDVTN